MSSGIRIGWLDQLIKKIHEEREYQELLQQVYTLSMQLKEAEKYFNLLKNLLKQAGEKLSKKNSDPALVENKAIKFSHNSHASK